MPQGMGLKKEIIAATQQANILQNALKKATTDKGISFISLQSELAKAGTTAENMVLTLAKAGPAFSSTFNTALISLATADRRLVSISAKIAEMKRVMTQSIKFTAAQTIQREFMSAISSSIGWVKDLNSAITDISVVTGKVGDELERVEINAINGSKALRVAADEYTKGALIFYQQGLDDQEVSRRTEITIKAAKAAGASIEEMSSQLTSIWNNYRMTGEEQERAASVGAALAAKTAVDFKDIATAMQSAAAPAAQMGVEYNQLAAIIATVGDVSQQSASTIGNAYKTIFSRFQQLKAEGTDGEVTLSSVSSQLESMGIHVLDAAGNLRDLGVVINEVGTNWDNWSQTQQTAIAQIVGGTRQYGQFLTLMQNFDKYQANLKTANGETGSSLEGQYERALDSIDSKMENSAEAWKRAFSQIFDEEMIKGFYEGIETLGNAVDSVFSTFEGIKGLLPLIAAIVLKNITPNIVDLGVKAKTAFDNLTPEKRQEQRKQDANKTRESALRAIGSNGQTSAEGAAVIKKGLDSLKGKNADERKAELQRLQQQASAQGKLNAQEASSLKTSMQKADIQEKIGEMSGEIEQLERLGTDAAKSKAEMLRKQVEQYGQMALALAEQTEELRRQARVDEGSLDFDRNEAMRANTAETANRVNPLMAQIEEAQAKKAELEGTIQQLLTNAEAGMTDWSEENIQAAAAEIAELEKSIKSLNDQIEDINTEQAAALTEELEELGQRGENGVQKLIEILGKKLTGEVLNSNDAGTKIKEHILNGMDGLGDDFSAVLKDALNDAGTSFEDIEIAVRNAFNQAFADDNGELSANMQARLSSITEALQSANTVSGASGNIFGSLNEGVQNLGMSAGEAAQKLVDVGTAATMTVTGFNGMKNAIENCDLIGFAAGLTTAITGLVQLKNSLSGLKSAILMVGSGMVKLGGNIAGIVPGLGGVTAGLNGVEGAALSAGAAQAVAFGIALVAIAAVAAAIAGIVYLFNEWKNSQPEAQAERLSEAAKSLAEEADSAKQSADDLRSSLEKYDSAAEALENCVAGTKEFKQALQEANQAALEVLDNVTGLSGDEIKDLYSRDKETGRITLNREKMDEVQEKMDSQAVQAQYAASMASQRAQLATQQVNAKNAVRTAGVNNDIAMAGVTTSGLTMGTSTLAGLYAKNEADNIDSQAIMDNIADLIDLTDDEFEAKLNELGIHISKTDSGFNSLKTSIQNLGESATAAQAKMELIADMAIDEALGDDYGNDVKNVSGDLLVAKQDEIYKDVLQFTKDGFSKVDWYDDSDGTNKAKLVERYNAATGNNWAADSNFSRGTDNNRTFAFLDEMGELHTLTAEQVASTIAAAEAMAEVTANAQGLAEVLNGLGDSGDQLKSLLATGSFSDSLTQEELKGIAGEDGEVSTEEADAFLMKSFEVDTAEELQEIADKMGVSLDYLRDQVVQGVAQSEQDFKDVAEGLTQSAKNIFESIDVEDMTANEQRALALQIQQAYANGGKENAEAVGKLIREGFGDQAGEAAEILSDIDWSNVTPELLADKLEEANISAENLGNEGLAELISRMKELEKASLSAAEATYQNNKELMDKVDNGNGKLTEDDYAKLTEAQKQYFQKTADGTYMLMGSAEEFYNTLQQESRDAMEAAQGEAVVRKETLENIASKYSLEDLQGSAEVTAGHGHNRYQTMNDEGAIDKASAQIELLKQLGAVGDEQLNDWEQRLSEGNLKLEDAQAIADEVSRATANYEGLDDAIKQASDDLEAANMEEWATEFADALDGAGIAMEDVNELADLLQDAADEGGEFAESLKDDRKAAMEVAKEITRFDKAVESVEDNYEDWMKVLEDGTLQDQAEIMDDVRDAYGNMLDLDGSALGSDFLTNTENMELMKKALEGDVEAYDTLAQRAGDSILIEAGVNLDDEAFLAAKDAFQTELDALNEGEGFDSLQVGAELNDQGFLDSLTEMVNAAGLSAEEAEAYLASQGIDAEVVQNTETQKEQVGTELIAHPYTRSVSYTPGAAGPDTPAVPQTATYPAVWYSKRPVYEEKTVSAAGVKVTSANKSSGGATKFSSSSGGSGLRSPSNSGGSKGGGGGGSSNPAKRTAITQRVKKERYVDHENAIEDLTTAINKLSTANDHAWGSQRIRNLNMINKKLKDQAKAYQLLRKEAENYIVADSSSLAEQLKEVNAKTGLNLTAKFDSNGLLDNEMEIRNFFADYINETYIAPMNNLEKQVNDVVKRGGTEDETKALKEQIETIKDSQSEIQELWDNGVAQSIDNLQEARRKYEEALEQEIQLIYDWLQNEIDKYSIKMELRIEISDIEYQIHDMLIKNMGEVGKMSKKVTDMIESDLKRLGGDVDEVIEHYGKMQNLADRWAARDESLKDELGITDAAWKEAIKSGEMPSEIKDAMASDIDELMDLRGQIWDKLDDQWQNYIDVIQYYIDEYDRITDRLDKQLSISDNLLSIIETTGLNYKWGADESAAQFKNMSTQMDILKTKASNLNGELAIATNRRKEAEEALNTLLNGRDAYTFSQEASEADMFEYNRIKEHYDEMADLEADLKEQRVALMSEAYDKATEYAEQWGEVIRHEMDEQLGALFDSMDDAMDMYNQKRDIDTFFMDEVDKVFELNKLQREIEKVLDDISDPEQLSRYNALLEEIEAKKQEGVELTEKDLEILQAQFDLEQARDAYEDARNAKNTMRLTRDASGNYSYVYSSDGDSIDDAEAKVEENLHNIYKLHREAADEYAETWLQLQVDWENYIDSIDKARYKQDEDYRQMVDQRMRWYSTQSDLLSQEIIKHNDAIGREFSTTTLGIITDTNDMDATNTTYKNHHTELKDKLLSNYDQWMDKADETMHEVSGSMSDLETVVNQETNEMMTEVNNLKTKIQNLNTSSQSALSQMQGFIGRWASTVNSYFQSVIDQIDATIKAYERLLQQQYDSASAAEDFDFDKDYASEYLAAIERGASEEELQGILDNRDYKMGQGYGPASAATNAVLKDIGSIWLSDPDLAKQALKTVQQTTWSSNDLDIGVLNSNIKGLNQGLDNLTNALAEQKSKKATALGYDGTNGNPDWRTASGGLITTPQVRSLAEEGPELVLNAEDTQKILEAVRLVRLQTQQALAFRDMQSQIAAAAQQASISEAQAAWEATRQETLDQQVHIEANFPGVSVAAEIEDAFNQLVTQAAQYRIRTDR